MVLINILFINNDTVCLMCAGDWGWSASRRIRRAQGHHGDGCPGRPHVPGGNAFRQPPRHDRGHQGVHSDFLVYDIEMLWLLFILYTKCFTSPRNWTGGLHIYERIARLGDNASEDRSSNPPAYPPRKNEPARHVHCWGDLDTGKNPRVLSYFWTPFFQTLEILQRPGSYEKLEALSKRLVEGILAAAKDAGHDACGGYIRGMFGFFFNKGPVMCFADAAKSDGGGLA